MQMMLVTFIALTCVSCSLFPKKDLNGTEVEKPKAAQTILTSLATINATLDVLYTSVSRGLEESTLSSLEQFIVEAAAKKAENKEQADLIKTGLEILVDLKSSKIDSSSFQESVKALRQAIILFDVSSLRYVQDVGRQSLPQGLSLNPEVFSINNSLARGLFTLAAVVERAGYRPNDGSLPNVPVEVSQRAKDIEAKLVKLKTETFLVLQPYLVESLTSSTAKTDSETPDKKQIDFAMAILENGVMLTSALQVQKDTGQIDKNGLSNSLKGWSSELKASIAAAGEDVPSLPTIPESAPLLDLTNGSLPSGTKDWVFQVLEKPALGSLDLAQNPPVYKPTSSDNFSIDRYSFRACFRMVPTFCTTAFSVIVQTPLKPWTVTIKTAEGVANTFVRGDELVCSAALESANQTPVFRWTLVGVRPVDGNPSVLQSKSMDVTGWQTTPGRLKTPNIKTGSAGADNDIREGDKVRCEVKARAGNGLESAFTAPTLAVMTAANSAPSNVLLPANFLGFSEQVAGESLPVGVSVDVEISDMDGAWTEYTDTSSAAHISSLTIEDCDSALPCPFEKEIPQSQTLSRLGTYFIKIKQIGSLNFEAKSHYDIKVKIVDIGSQQIVRVLRIPVINRNDPVTAITPNSVEEFENETLVSTLTSVDDDCVSEDQCQNSYTYSISGADASYFEIVGRTLRSKAALDFEQLEASVRRSPSYSIILTPTDAAGVVQLGRTLTIAVKNQNEQPSEISLSNATISENTGAAVELGELTTADPDAVVADSDDGIQGNFSYTLTMLNTEINYFEVVGNKIRTTSHKINYELTPTLSFVVTSRDLGGQTKSKTFTVTVFDLNEAPTSVSFSQSSLVHVKNIQGQDPDELTPTIDINSFMDLYAVDPDGTAQSFTFEIIKTNDVEFDSSNAVSHPFIIVGSTLQPQRVLNYTSVNDRVTKIKVRVKDQHDLFSPEVELTVNLQEIILNSATVTENVGSTIVGQMCVGIGVGSDCSSDWTYSLIEQPAGGYFTVAGKDLTATKSIDFETFPGLTLNAPILGSPRSGYFYLKVRAAKTGVFDFTQQIKITITDQNERPTAIQLIRPDTLVSTNQDDSSLYILDGQQATGEFIKVLTLETSDTDMGDEMTWTIIASSIYSPDRKYFELVKISDFRAEVRLCVEIDEDCEALPTGATEFNIRVQVSDQESLSRIRDLKFTVVPYPKVTLWSGATGPFHRGLHEIADDALKIDLRIDDKSNKTPCSLVGIAESTAGVIVKAITHSGEPVLASEGITISLTQDGSGFKRCTLSLLPLENAAGVATLSLMARAETNIGSGLLDSRETDDLSVDVTFWRNPELRCPQRINLPVNTSLVNMECKVHYSDSSAPSPRSESISISDCGTQSLEWTDGRISSGEMPSEACTATVSVSGVVNKFNVPVSFTPKSLTLAPRRFGTNGAVFASAQDADGNIYLGGSFTAVNPVPAAGSTSVNVADGTRGAECNLTEGFNGKVNAVVYDPADDSFLIGGDFTTYRNQAAKRLIRLTCSGEPAAWFTNKGFDGPVNAILKATDGTFLVGGTFTKYGTETSRALVRLKANGVRKSLYGGFNQQTSSDGVYALALAATTPESVWVGGQFSAYPASQAFPAVNAPNLVRIRLDTGENQLETSHGLDLPVYALTSFSNGVYAGGEMSGPRKYTNKGEIDVSFAPGSAFADTVVRSLLLSSASELIVGATGMVAMLNAADGALNGDFGNAGKLELTHINPYETPTAYDLKMLGTDVFVGGRFTKIRGESRLNVAKFSVDSQSFGTISSDFSLSPGPNDAVRALALHNSNGSLFLGGEFSATGGTPVGRLAAFASDGSFHANLNQSLGSGFNSDVLALLFSGNDLFVGGAFTELNNLPQVRLVKLLNPDGASGGANIVDPNFDISEGFNGEVRALALAPDASGKLLVGGSFTQYRSAVVPSLVRLEASGTSASPVARDTSFGASFVGNAGRNVSVNAIKVTAASAGAYSVFVGGDFSKCNYAASANLVKVNQNGQRDINFAVGSDGFNGPVRALLLLGSNLYVGGSFSTFKGTASENLISVNTINATVASAANLSGGEVRALHADSSGGFWAGGAFTGHALPGTTTVATGPFVRLASNLDLSSNSGIGTAMGPHQPSEFNLAGSGFHYNASLYGVHTLLHKLETVGSETAPRLYLGGFLALIRGYAVTHVARIDAASSAATPPE